MHASSSKRPLWLITVNLYVSSAHSLNVSSEHLIHFLHMSNAVFFSRTILFIFFCNVFQSITLVDLIQWWLYILQVQVVQVTLSDGRQSTTDTGWQMAPQRRSTFKPNEAVVFICLPMQVVVSGLKPWATRAADR